MNFIKHIKSSLVAGIIIIIIYAVVVLGFISLLSITTDVKWFGYSINKPLTALSPIITTLLIYYPSGFIYSSINTEISTVHIVLSSVVFNFIMIYSAATYNQVTIIGVLVVFLGAVFALLGSLHAKRQ